MNKYYVADSFKNWDRVGEPYDKSGRLYTKIKTKCPRCGGLGIIVARVENNQSIPIPVDKGICYQCGGAKYVTKEARLYTESEYNTMQRNKEREKERKAAAAEAKMKAEFETKKADWLKRNGFDAEGKTYIYIGSDSYQRKEELKGKGYIFNPILKWHSPLPENEKKIEQHDVTDFYSITAWGDYTPISGAADKVQAIIDAAKPASTSHWIGTEGEKIKDLSVTLVGIRGFETRFGYSQAVTFNDAEGDVLTWFTSVNIPFEISDSCKLSGTVKKLDEYKGCKQTILTRCKLS